MTSTLKHLLITLLLIGLANNILFSQSVNYIEGKVLNSTLPEPVPFATIHLINNQLGVYANADGDFKIIRSSEFLSDSVIITCIGYKRYSVAFKNLSDSSVNKIYLDPIIYKLGEVSVISSARKLGSIAIIRRAIKNIPINYPSKPFNYISYYRDYQKDGAKYINLNEAIVQTLDNGFGAKSIINRYRLLDFRKNMEFPRINITPNYESSTNDNKDSAKTIPEAQLGDQYGNELFVLLVHDPVRNFDTRSFSFIETFSKDFLINHNFAEPIPVYNNNLLLFKIIFNGKSRIIGNLFRISGAIYIQPRTYSIHKIEYSCSYLTEGKTGGDMFNVDIEYGHENSIDSLMYLKYISFNNYFKVKNSDDSTYFRVLGARWETKQFLNPTLIVDFNNKIDPRSATDKGNYKIKVAKKDIKISSVQAVGSTLYIRTKDQIIANKKDSCWFNIENVKDTDGNLLNTQKSMELFQFRELFVQEYNKPITFRDTCYLKYLPLDKNCKSSYAGNEKYWMNTPAIVKIPHPSPSP